MCLSTLKAALNPMKPPKRGREPALFMRREPWDLTEVQKLLQELPPSHQDYALLNHVLKHSKDGFLQVEYNHGKWVNFGRVYAHRGLQRCTSEVRVRCAQRFARELDVRNCHPTILQNIFERHNLKCDALAHYNTNRDEILNQIAAEHPQWNQKDVKRLFLICQYLGQYQRHTEGVQIPFLDAFQRDMHENAQKLVERMPELARLVKVAKRLNRRDALATGMSYLCQIEEARIIQAAADFIGRDNEIYTDRHDGFLFAKGPDVDLLALSNYVFEKTGYRVQFKVEDLKALPSPSDVFPRTCDNAKPVVVFDVEGTLISGCGKRATLRPGLAELQRLVQAGFRVGLFSSKAQRRIPFERLLMGTGMTQFDIVLAGEWCYSASADYALANHLPEEVAAPACKKWIKVKPLSKIGCALDLVTLVDTNDAKVVPEERHRVRCVREWSAGMEDDGELKRVVDAILAGLPEQNTATLPENGHWLAGVHVFEHMTETEVADIAPLPGTRAYAILASMGMKKTRRLRQLLCRLGLITPSALAQIRRFVKIKKSQGDIRDFLARVQALKVSGNFERVLVISTRISLSIEQRGLFPGFDHYQQQGITFCEPKLCTQYESLHRLSQAHQQPYDLIVLDEMRSLVDNMLCEKTNPGNRLHENFETFRALLEASKLVVCMDAHLEFDAAVPKLLQHIFRPSEIELHRYHQHAMKRTLRVQVNESNFVQSIESALVKKEKVAIVCRTEANAQCYAKLFAHFAPFVVTSKTEDMSAFSNVNKFLAREKTRLMIYTSRVSVGVNIILPWDRVFLDFRGRQGASARNCIQMSGRIRRLRNRTIEVLSEYKFGKTVDVDREVLEYTTLRKKLSSEHAKLLISGKRQFEPGRGLIYAPDIIGQLSAESLKEHLQDKMVALRGLAKLEGWKIAFDVEEKNTAHEAAHCTRVQVKREHTQHEHEVFESVSALPPQQRTELLTDFRNRASKRQKLNALQAEKVGVAKVLTSYSKPLNFKEFRCARAHAKVIEQHAKLATPSSLEQNIEEEQRKNKPWFDQVGRFRTLENQLLLRALSLVNISEPTAFGSVVDKSKLEAHADEIIRLTSESAAADRRRVRPSVRSTASLQALVALRRELQHTWGTTVVTTYQGADKVPELVYKPQRTIAGLAKKLKPHGGLDECIQ